MVTLVGRNCPRKWHPATCLGGESANFSSRPLIWSVYEPAIRATRRGRWFGSSRRRRGACWDFRLARIEIERHDGIGADGVTGKPMQRQYAKPEFYLPVSRPNAQALENHLNIASQLPESPALASQFLHAVQLDQAPFSDDRRPEAEDLVTATSLIKV
jgi:hypothetical protein